MADVDTPTNCTLLTSWNDDPDNIDWWTFSHQILPFFAVIYGFDFRWVIIVAYFCETVENFVWCLERRYIERFENSIIADPIQGIVGSCIGLLFLYLTKSAGINNILKEKHEYAYIFSSEWKNRVPGLLFDVTFLVCPSLIFYRDSRNLDWLYLCLFPISYFIITLRITNYVDDLNAYNIQARIYDFVIAYIYVIILAIVVFAHPLEINSFYSSIITSLAVLVVSLFLYRVKKGDSNSVSTEYI